MKTLRNTLEKLQKENKHLVSLGLKVNNSEDFASIRFKISSDITNIQDYHELVNLIYSRILMCGWQTALGSDTMQMDTDGIKQLFVARMTDHQKEHALSHGLRGIDPVDCAGRRDKHVGQALIYITSFIE